MSFALIGAAALGGFSKGFGEEVLREKQRKKEEEKEYLDRYSKAAQYALTQATNDRNKRTTKVDNHKSNLSMLTETIKTSFGVSSSEARQVAAQMYKQSPTSEAAKIGAAQIKQSLNSIGSDSANRRAAFDKLGAVVNEGEFSSLDMLAQSFAGPRPIYKDYMPAMGTFDSRTFIEKFFDGDDGPRESSTVTQTKEMFANMGGKQPSDTSISIPDSDITLPQTIEIDTAEKKADRHYARYRDALDKKDFELADKEMANYIVERKRAVAEAAELSKSDGFGGHYKLREMFAKDFERAGKANSLRFSGDHLLNEIAVGSGSERMEIGMKTALYTNYLEYIQLDEQYKEQYFKALNAAANTVSVGKFEPSELKVQLENAHEVRQNITTLTGYIKKLKDTDISEGAEDTTFKKFAEAMRNTGTDDVSKQLRADFAKDIANAFFLPNEPFYTDKIIGYFQ
tara:strand:- start:1539 stop:2903 length:1365 start_codon:yes stop_codon:yes gene_type:complete